MCYVSAIMAAIRNDMESNMRTSRTAIQNQARFAFHLQGRVRKHGMGVPRRTQNQPEFDNEQFLASLFYDARWSN